MWTVYLDGTEWATDVTEEKARAIVAAYDGEKDCWCEEEPEEEEEN